MSRIRHACLAGIAVAVGRDVGRGGGQLRAVLRTRDQRPALSVPHRRCGDGTGVRAVAVADRPRVARVSARRAPGNVLRLPRVRSVGSGAWPPVQPGEGPARSVRAHHRPAADVASVAVRVCAGNERRRPGRAHRQRTLRAAGRDHRAGVHLGRRPAAADAVARDGDLRAAREGHDRETSERSRRASRHVSRACHPRRSSNTCRTSASRRSS